jgi:signal peptidase II
MPVDSLVRVGRRRGYADVLAVGFGVFAADQLTKLVVKRTLDLHDSIRVLDGFLNIVHARNPGAAFSFLADAPAWFRGPFFIAITASAIGVLLYAITRLPAEDRLLRLALGGVLGGALGNLFDRLVYGEVIDFIDVHWKGHHWPAFNVADSSITVAVVAVILQSLIFHRAEGPQPASGSAGGSVP